jgi:hypothetical protein
MRITRFQYPLEDSIIKKIDLMIKRCIQRNPKRDSVLLIEGQEGEGKTSYSVAIAYYVSEQTRRNFSHKNVFSDLTKMISFLQDNEGQIAIWDEPALQALSGDSLSKIVKDLKRMLMMCRNKRHFIIINMTYFNEFGNYIVFQRPLGMIHVYSRNETDPGRFIYIKKKNLEKLYWDWRSKKLRNYKKYSSRKCRGTFPDVLNEYYKYNVLGEFDFKEYEKNKNEAIASIGKETKKLNERELKKQLLLSFLNNCITHEIKLTQKQLGLVFDLSDRTIRRLISTPEFRTRDARTLINTLGLEEKNEENLEEEDIVVEKPTTNNKGGVPINL